MSGLLDTLQQLLRALTDPVPFMNFTFAGFAPARSAVRTGEDVHRPINIPSPSCCNSSWPSSSLLPHPLPCCLHLLLLALILLRPQVLQERFPFLSRRRRTYDCCLTQETLHG